MRKSISFGIWISFLDRPMGTLRWYWSMMIHRRLWIYLRWVCHARFQCACNPSGKQRCICIKKRRYQCSQWWVYFFSGRWRDADFECIGALKRGYGQCGCGYDVGKTGSHFLCWFRPGRGCFFQQGAFRWSGIFLGCPCRSSTIVLFLPCIVLQGVSGESLVWGRSDYQRGQLLYVSMCAADAYGPCDWSCGI